VHHNGRERLAGCLAALSGQSLPHETIVVDSASTDGSLAPLVKQFPAVRFIPLGRNVGFARGANIGAQAAGERADIIVTLNPDTVPDREFLVRITEPFDDRTVASAAGRLLFASAPDTIASEGIRVFRNGVALDAGLGEPVAASAAREIFGPSGGAAAYRLDAFREAGGFCDAFFLYLEDVDLAWRLRLLGWRSICVPTATATHAYSASSIEGSPFKRRHLSRNRLWTIARCLPSELWRRDRWEIARFDAAALAWAAVHGDTALQAGRIEALARIAPRLCERREIQRAVSVDAGSLSRWVEPSPHRSELLRLRRLTASLALKRPSPT
jgi:GT2 family glycosyltransferase